MIALRKEEEQTCDCPSTITMESRGRSSRSKSADTLQTAENRENANVNSRNISNDDPMMSEINKETKSFSAHDRLTTEVEIHSGRENRERNDTTTLNLSKKKAKSEMASNKRKKKPQEADVKGTVLTCCLIGLVGLYLGNIKYLLTKTTMEELNIHGRAPECQQGNTWYMTKQCTSIKTSSLPKLMEESHNNINTAFYENKFSLADAFNEVAVC